MNHPQANPAASPPRKGWPWLLGVGLLAALLYWQGNSAPKEEATNSKGRGQGPTVVTTTLAQNGPMRLRLEALGTIVPARLVTVRARVDGQLQHIAFKEGEAVQEGDLLAEIDPKPFQIALSQVKGQLARDSALLENARNDANRYQSLLAKNSVSRQQVDTQLALVRQYQGAVDVDRALLDNANLQLSYTRITAPISGIAGFRQVDAGNMIRQSEPGGLVTIAQVDPIQVLFSLAEDHLPLLRHHWRPGQNLAVELFDRERKNHLAPCTLLTLDNQIDPATGTIKLKAECRNQEGRLYPNQFVNVTLTLATRQDALLIPGNAVQRGRQGTFVYKVTAEETIELQPVKTGPSEGEQTAIEEGLSVGDRVVVEGSDKLRPGSKITEAAPAKRKGRGEP